MPEEIVKLSIDELPAEFRLLTPEEQKQKAKEKGFEIDYGPGGERPAMPKRPDAILRDNPRTAPSSMSDLPYAEAGAGAWQAPMDPPLKTLTKAAMGAGGMALGGAGPVGMAIGAGTNAAWGADPGSGRSIADMAINAIAPGGTKLIDKGAALIPYLPQIAAKAPGLATALANAAKGGGTVAIDQILGNILAKAKGETVEPMDYGTMALGAAGGMGAPVVLGRIAQAFEKATPAVRAKLQPILEKLQQSMGGNRSPAPAAVPSLIPPVAAEQAAARVVPEIAPAEPLAATGATHTVPTAGPTIPVNPAETAISSSVEAAAKAAASLPHQELRAQKMAEILKGLGTQPYQVEQMGSDQWAMLEKAAKITPTSETTRIMLAKMMGADPAKMGFTTPTTAETPTAAIATPPTARLAPQPIPGAGAPVNPDPNVTTVPENWITARAATPAPVTPPTTLPEEWTTVAATNQRQQLRSGIYGEMDARLADLKKNPIPNADAMRVANEVKTAGPDLYFDKMLKDSEGITKLMTDLPHLDAAFPDGQPRKALQQKVIQQVMDGIQGDASGKFQDLSILQRIKSFGNQRIGGKMGSEVLNSVFESPEAYKNLSDLHDLAEESIAAQQSGSGKGILRYILNPKAALAGSTGLAGLGTIYLSSHGFGPIPTMAAAAGATAGTVKAFTIGADAVADLISRKNSKWADVLLDMSRGGVRHSPGTISNVVSGIRRRAEQERDLTLARAQAEMAAGQ